MRHPEGPRLTVDAIWVRRGSILLVRRGRPPFEGRWALPGGFVEAGETVETAVARELREETGLIARASGLVGVFSDPGRDPRGPSATVAFWMEGRGGVPRGGDDAREAAWVPLTEARGLAFDHDEIVSEAIGRSRGGRLVRVRRAGPGRPAARRVVDRYAGEADAGERGPK